MSALTMLIALAPLLFPIATPQGSGEVRSAPAPLPSPGELPAGASELARSRWQALVGAALGAGGGRVSSFDLNFDVSVYPKEGQSNESSARYFYMEPGWVRMVLRSGRERMRGPRGDYLVSREGVTPLRGRDYAEDKRELDETVALARTFVGLSDPGQLRLVSLETSDAPAGMLPEELRKGLDGLEWITVQSPDFRGPVQGDKEPRLDRIEIGLDAKTKLPTLALVRDARNPHGALLVRLSGYLELDGYRVPGQVRAWRIDPESRPLRFAAKQAVDMWLIEGDLSPELTPADFEPAG